MSGGTGLLLLCEAELGKPMYEIPTGDSNAEEQAKKHNCVSTLGVGRTAPQGWVDGEFINDTLKGVQVVSSMFFVDRFSATDTVFLGSPTSQKDLAPTRPRMPTGICNTMSTFVMMLLN